MRVRPAGLGVALLLALAVTGWRAAAGGAARVPAPRTAAGRQYSLLIGVGTYQHAAGWEDLKNLKGPPGDVGRMRHALRRWGFASDTASQRVLLDARASREGILAGLRWLATVARDSTDVVVVYYSGHGSWAPDLALDGVRRRDEHLASSGDEFDEGLVPWDARDPHDPRQLLLDDEIQAWLQSLRTANVTLIIDACFSGTVTRGEAEPAGELAPTARGPRAPATLALGEVAASLEGAASGRHTLLTATNAWELAYERTYRPGGVVSGVFTRALTGALENAGPATRFSELIERVREQVGEGQTPQLEGDAGARLFRVAEAVDVPARGFAIATARGAGRVTLDVGAIHGVLAGSVYDLFGATETAFLGRPLAQVRVDSVQEGTAGARLLGSARVPEGARAVLSRVPPGARTLGRLPVFVAPSAAALRDTLGAFPWIRMVDRQADASVEIRQAAPGVFQVRANGHLIVPIAADAAQGHARRAESGAAAIRGHAGTAAALCGPLARGFFWGALDLVRNPSAPPELGVRLRIQPVGRAPTWPATGVDTARVGQRYELWAMVELPDSLVRRSRLYLSVAVAGLTEAPAVIWPAAGSVNVPLAPDQLNRPLRLLGAPVTISPVTGIEEFTVVVHSDPYDLRPLLRSAPTCEVTRSVGGAEEPAGLTGWTSVRRLLVRLP